MTKSRSDLDHRAGAEPYQIRLQGHLADRWADWFDEMDLTCEDDGTTLLTGPVADQAALHGLLHKVRDTGLALVSVTALDPDRPIQDHHHDTTAATRRPT